MGRSAGIPHPVTAQRPAAAARRAATSPWIGRAARVGLAARGLVYLMIGYFALQIAFGHSSRRANRGGAFHAIAREPWGPALLWVMAVGFFGYALWRLAEAAFGHADESSTAKRLGQRLFSLARAVVYALIGFSAASLASGSGSGGSGGSGGSPRSASADLLKQPYGVPLLTALGGAVIVAGLVMAYQGFAKKFEEDLRTDRMSPRVRGVVQKTGMAGLAGRGAVVALVGVFVVESALTFDPKKAKGLDASLRALAQNGWGKVVLVLVAIGLLAFGVYSFFDARYRRTDGGQGGAAPYPSAPGTRVATSAP